MKRSQQAEVRPCQTLADHFLLCQKSQVWQNQYILVRKTHGKVPDQCLVHQENGASLEIPEKLILSLGQRKVSEWGNETYERSRYTSLL